MNNHDKSISLIRTMYKQHGLLSLSNMYSKETIDDWNHRLDPLFNERATQKRSYVKADELLALGILEEVMSPKLMNTINLLDPCPIFFHCHCFEIEGNSSQNHIGFDELDGWHRDHSDPNIKSVYGCRPSSVFIYLSDVPSTNYGSFEIIPDYDSGPLESDLDCCNITGDKGTTFLWNRDLYHRPNVNSSPVRRRILKLSIQTNGWANSRIHLDEFKNALSALGDDNQALAYLLGSHFDNYQATLTMPHSQTAELPQVTSISSSTKTKIPNKAEVMLRRIRNKVDKALRL
ncbi:hypothetical protein [Pseudoalteromonas rubra]|uniref:Phytanoyl-CoA dioxygenase n=1 Tax=Pseudoalteromonas rubra TaxID=43658 RepID=A0A0U3HSD9_9GAMM|nr:hypothetical protein [Pseudoalteromonas rubra]ALU45845.1 hypothetical protein AT705_23240 [Pseudoalteromonas rubra]